MAVRFLVDHLSHFEEVFNLSDRILQWPYYNHHLLSTRMTRRARTEGENVHPSISEHSRRHPGKRLGHEPNVLTAMTRVLFVLTSTRPALFW